MTASDDEMDDELELGSRSNSPGSAPVQGAVTSSSQVPMDVDAKPNGVHVHDTCASELPAHLFDEEDDDEIAEILPIYISHSISPSLHLFQYPLHHGRAPEPSEWARENGEIVTARMKEEVRRFELEVPVDMRTQVWNDERAEEMGFVQDSGNEVRRKGKGKEKDEPRKWGTKIRLRSEEVPEVTGYWSGIVHDGALHLQPIPHLFQLRPSLKYLDVAEAILRAENEKKRREIAGEDPDEAGAGGAGGAKKEPDQAELDLKAVVSQASNRDTISQLDQRRTKMGTAGTIGSTDEIKAGIVTRAQRENADPWVTWEWAVEAEDTLEVLNKMLVPPDRRAVLECGTKPLDVLSIKNIGKGAVLPN